jgi:diguanylate cyclase (GGDEF)-like protein
MSAKLHVLLVEDSENDALLIIRHLKKGGYDTQHIRVFNQHDLDDALRSQHWDIVISDHNMPNFSSDLTLSTVQNFNKDLPVILVSGTIGEETAVKAMRTGAHDYIMKNNLTRLVPAVERELRESVNRKSQREAEQQIHYMASHDALTGLINRFEFEKKLQEMLSALSKGMKHAFLYIDLDQFKIVNDTSGHIAGDELLRQLSLIMEKEIRANDTLARLGGDEFGVLLDNCPLTVAETIAEKIITSIKAFYFSWQEKTFTVSASIGLVVIDENYHEAAEIMSAADMACYSAKDSGRNRLHIYQPDDADMARRQSEMEWVSKLQLAITEDRFQLYKQCISPLNNAHKSLSCCEFLLRLNDGEEVLLVRTEGAIQTLDDVRAIVVRADMQEPVRVADVAEVRIGSLTRYGAVTKDGKGEAVEGLVLGLRGANANALVKGVRAKLDELAPGLPEGVTINVFYDRGKLVSQAVGTVTKALGEAIVLVVILLLLFLGNLRAALTVALVLPLAALITFILMYQFGLSANLMSLGGLAIAIGMLVDAAVVVVENVVSQLAQKGQSRLPRLHLIYRAAREVAVPMTSGILIIIIVFLPLLTLQGLEGKLFIPVALTIVFALSGSLLLSLTVIPVLASYLLGKVSHEEPLLVRLLHKVYTPVLDWSLRHVKLVVAVALALLVAAGFVYTQVGKTFMPTMDEGDLIVQLEKLPSINLEQSLQIDMAFQRELLKRVPEVTSVIARTGSDELGLDPMGLNETDSFLVLKPVDEWTVPDKDALKEKIRAVLADFPGVAYAFTQPIEMRVSEMLTGVRGDLAIKIFGEDQDDLNRTAEAIVKVVQGIDGATDVYFPRNEGAQYFKLVVDRLAAGRLGLDVVEVHHLVLDVEVQLAPEEAAQVLVDEVVERVARRVFGQVLFEQRAVRILLRRFERG